MKSRPVKNEKYSRKTGSPFFLTFLVDIIHRPLFLWYPGNSSGSEIQLGIAAIAVTEGQTSVFISPLAVGMIMVIHLYGSGSRIRMT
jgi:hypothetical protein